MACLIFQDITEEFSQDKVIETLFKDETVEVEGTYNILLVNQNP